MNKISISPFEQFPLELYTKMIGIDDSFKIEDLGTPVTANLEMLRSWSTLAMTSHQLFINVMHALHNSTIFKSLVSQSSEDRESFSLFRAFKPSVDFVKNMSGPNKALILFDQEDPNLQTRIQSFFDVFCCIRTATYTQSRKLPIICNIVEFVPHFLFELSMARWVRPSATSVCREHYRKINGKETLSDCLTALENVSITPPSNRQDNNEREKIITAIRYRPERLRHLSPDSLTTDAEYSFEYYLATRKIDEFLRLFENKREDEKVALETVRRDGSKLKNFPSFKNNRQVVLAAVQNHRQALKYAHDDLKQDKVIVLAAVRQHGLALQYAHDNLKLDKDVVRTAVHRNGQALRLAHNDLKKDKDIVLATVQQDAIALALAHEDLQKDRDIVLAAVQQNGVALALAPEDLQKDRDIVLAAIQQDGQALQFAHDDLKGNETIALTAISQNPRALRHALGLKDDREFIPKAMNANYCVFYHLNEEMQQDPEIIEIFNKNRRIWETEIPSHR